MSFDFFARGLHTRTAVARLPLRQLAFLVSPEVESLAYIFAADNMGLHSIVCGGRRKTHLFCNTVRIGRSR